MPMRCPRCNNQNASDALFCEECGTPIEQRCPACGNASTPGARYCKKCGHRFGAGSEPLRPDGVAARAAGSGLRVSPEASVSETTEGERKTVTALFADIKGSMELMEDLDPEEARRIVDPALQLMMEAVHRYDGYVAQSTGDGIFALFGAPVAHEDHPQRALYAALRMQERDEALLERHCARQGHPPI